MKSSEPAQLLTEKYLPSLSLSRLGDETEAGLWITSLPWPRTQALPLHLNGQPTELQPLGQWPGEDASTPRRLLLIADGNNSAPETVSLQQDTKAPTQPLPVATMQRIERSPLVDYVWERSYLQVEYSGRTMGIALGLRTGEEIHWWEACRMVEVERTPHCLTLEIGGAIPHKIMDDETFRGHPGLTNPFLHKHNWLNGHALLRLHANGVCEVYARHTNSKYVDDGAILEDAVPVVGFRLLDDAARADASTLAGENGGVWDGTRKEIRLGQVRFDVAEVARLSTPTQPGRLDAQNDFLVWQPYEGFELFGGTCPAQLIGDEFIIRSKSKTILRGMSRTLRFSFSLSDRSPRVVRYAAPAWWYGACEEFSPAPYLPVSNEYGNKLEWGREWVQEVIVKGGFEDGSMPRSAKHPQEERASNSDAPRNEPSWEGELPHAQFLSAWRSGAVEDYEAAMRSAYHFSDLAIDHAAKIVRMHGYPPHAFALPMARLQATIVAFLETGDRFLLEAAEATTANAFWLHKNSWPRLAVGRDACFIRSAILLYRYFNNDYFRRLAYEGIQTVGQAQRPDGSFGDQGGGTGLHQWGAYITKPWMAMLAVGGALDYLELFPEDELSASIARKTADWMMSERVERDGVTGWCYQHGFNDGRTYYNPFTNETRTLPDKGWHQENIGRLMLMVTQQSGDPAYADAWAQSFVGRKGGGGGDHYISSAFQFIPWIQDHLWRAELTSDGVRIEPTHFGERTPKEAAIIAPEGELRVQWQDGQKVSTPDGVYEVARDKS